jgi:hypothetical protein
MNRREEALLREWIREELASGRLDEGVLDTLKGTIAKLARSLSSKLDAGVSALRKSEAAAEDLTDIVLDAEGGTKVVSAINRLGSDFKDAAEAVMGHDVKPPAANEAALKAAMPILLELNGTLSQKSGARRLDEVGAFEVVGLGLGLVGGIPLLLKGLYKLAKLFKMGKAADLLKRMYEAAHHLEEGFVDVVIPDRVSYAIYTKYQEARHPEKVANFKVWEAEPDSAVSRAIKPAQRILSAEEYANSPQRKKLEKGLYVVLLTPWLINGLLALKHFISNVINWAEGAATAVKGLEAGELASMTAELIQGGAASLEDAAVALSTAVDAIDDITRMG